MIIIMQMIVMILIFVFLVSIVIVTIINMLMAMFVSIRIVMLMIMMLLRVMMIMIWMMMSVQTMMTMITVLMTNNRVTNANGVNVFYDFVVDDYNNFRSAPRFHICWVQIGPLFGCQRSTPKTTIFILFFTT